MSSVAPGPGSLPLSRLLPEALPKHSAHGPPPRDPEPGPSKKRRKGPVSCSSPWTLGPTPCHPPPRFSMYHGLGRPARGLAVPQLGGRAGSSAWALVSYSCPCRPSSPGPVPPPPPAASVPLRLSCRAGSAAPGADPTHPLLLSGPPRPTPFLGGVSPHPSASAPSLSFLICKVQATVVPLMGAGQSWRPWCVPPSPGLSLGLSQAHCPFISDADAGLA